MSFLLREPTDRKNNQIGARSLRSVNSLRNSNDPARNAVDSNSRIFSGLRSRGLKRSSRKLSQQQISGNQLILQHQKRRSIATTSRLQKEQFQQEEQKNQQCQEYEAAEQQEQENLGDYTMDRVMQDLQILEQQQREAKRKLESAQTTKQKRLDQMRQLNTLLENKNYSNGALRAKLQQSHDFLSIATRDLGSRKLATDRLQGGIKQFGKKLKRGLRSAKMIQVCSAKIDSLLLVIEHKVATMRRLRIERTQIGTEIRQKYEQTEKKDRQLRSAIQHAHKSVRKWGDEKIALRTQISKLDKDKSIAQNTDQVTRLQMQGARDKFVIEADRFVMSKRKLFEETEKVTKEKETLSSEIKAKSTTVEVLKQKVQGFGEKIVEYCKVEGHTLSNDGTPVFDQDIFRGDIERIEEETKDGELALLTLKKSIEDLERAWKMSNETTLQNEKEASRLVSAAKSLTEEENKRKQLALDSMVSLERKRGEMTKLEESFQEMQATRASEARMNLKKIAHFEDEIKQQTKEVEDLRLKIKQEDTSLKTKIRLFEDVEKLPLLRNLEAAKKKLLVEEKKYRDLVNLSSAASIESKLRAQFRPKIDDETKKWEAKNKRMISASEKYLQKFSCLQDIDYKFVTGEDRETQIDEALANLARDCTTRKTTARAIEDQEALSRKNRRVEAATSTKKVKKKEEVKSRFKRRQFHNGFNRRKEGSNFSSEGADRKDIRENFGDSFTSSKRNETAGRRYRRRRKGADFFDPRTEDEGDGIANDLTPTNPRKLISSFMSQSSGQRVRWADGKDSRNDNCIGFADDTIGDSKNVPQERCASTSFHQSHKSKMKSRGIEKTERSSTKSPNIATSKEDKSKTSIFDDNSLLERKKESSDGDSRPSLGSLVKRIDSKAPRNGRIQCSGSMSRLPEENIVSSSPSTSRKTMGLESTRKKKRIAEPRLFLQSESTMVSKDRKRSSSSTMQNGITSGLSSSSRDSSDISKARKSNSKRSHVESRQKTCRKIKQDGSVTSSSKDVNHVSKRQKTAHDTKKPQFQNLEGRMLGIVRKERGNRLDIMLPEDKKRDEKTSKISHHKIEKEKLRREHIDRATYVSSLVGGTGRKTKSVTSRNKNRSKNKEGTKGSRYLFTDAEDDTFSLQVQNECGSNHSKVSNADTNPHGNDRHSSKRSRLEGSMKRCALEQSSRKSRAKSSNEKCKSSSRRTDSKESQDKVRKFSISGRSSVQSTIDDSHKKKTATSDSSSRSTTSQIAGKIFAMSRSKSRKSLSGGDDDKRRSRKDLKSSSNAARDDKSAREKCTSSTGTKSAKASSSIDRNGSQRKRNLNADNVSVSSSKTSVTARRRKKRKPGLSQRSTASSVVDESWNFSFQ